MAEPIETVIFCTQQSFEIAGGLNPEQIKIEDDRISKDIKMYRLTPLGLLFPASIKNDTE